MMKKLLSVVIIFIFAFSMFSFSASAAIENEALLTVSPASPIDVAAKAYILMDVNTGTVLMANNENEKLYPASVTKIMSLLLVFEAISQGKLTYDMVLTCSDTAAQKGGSQIWLEPGEQMSVHELLKAVVVYSANDACCLLGEAVAGSEEAFCAMMNSRARELGMNATNFLNCTGLDDDITEHKTTAYDIALMSRALLLQGEVRKYTGIWMDTLRNGQTQLVNTNKLMRTYPGATGLKTGTTSKAGCCVSASAERDGLELVAVVLGADNSKDRFSAATRLLDHGFSAYQIFTPQPENKYPSSVPVKCGVENSITVENSVPSEILIDKGKESMIEYEVQCSEELIAPIEKGQVIGKVICKYNSEVIGSIELTSGQKVEKKTLVNALYALFVQFKSNIS